MSSETQESIIRSQAILMIARNVGKDNITKKIMKRFLKCLKGMV